MSSAAYERPGRQLSSSAAVHRTMSSPTKSGHGGLDGPLWRPSNPGDGHSTANTVALIKHNLQNTQQSNASEAARRVLLSHTGPVNGRPLTNRVSSTAPTSDQRPRNNASDTWSSQHMFRTTYRDMSQKSPVPTQKLSDTTQPPRATKYAQALHATGNLRSSLHTIPPNRAGEGRSDLTQFLDTHPERPPAALFADRLERKAGFDGFYENVVRYPPQKSQAPLNPKTFIPWQQRKFLHFDGHPQGFDYDGSRDLSGSKGGSFVPMSASIKPGAYRDFHRQTGLVTEGGKMTTTFEMPAGYMHYTFPYSQAWQVAPVPKPALNQVQGRSGPYGELPGSY